MPSGTVPYRERRKHPQFKLSIEGRISKSWPGGSLRKRAAGRAEHGGEELEKGEGGVGAIEHSRCGTTVRRLAYPRHSPATERASVWRCERGYWAIKLTRLDLRGCRRADQRDR